jgi:hypothetical protein
MPCPSCRLPPRNRRHGVFGRVIQQQIRFQSFLKRFLMDLLDLIVMYICLLVCWVNYRRLDPSYLRYFLWFLVFTALLETTCYYLARHKIQNLWLYNLSTLVEVVFLSFIYSKAIEMPAIRKVIHWFMGFYAVLFIANATFIQGWHDFHTFTYVVGGLALLTWVGIYFIQLVQNPQFADLTEQSLFWISTGLLFHYIGKTPYLGMLNYLVENHMDVAKKYYVLVQILIVVEYCLLSAGFLCRRANHK